MSSLFKELFGLSARMGETGMNVMSAAMKTAQTVIAAAAGQPAPRPLLGPPVDGHADLDRITSDFFNRAARILRYAVLTGGSGLRRLPSDLLDAAQQSFGHLDLKDPRRLASLPLQLPLSLGTLLTQETERALHAFRICGPKGTGFLVEVAEVFLDLSVYFSLQYRQEIERYRERLRLVPDDSRARLQLARSYIKCGLHDLAISELAIAAQDPAVRVQALYQRSVANYRAGNYGDAIRDGVASLKLQPEPRAHYWTWLASQKLGGYPPEVPPELRIEMRAGRHPTALRYENVAAQIGLDKTSGGRGSAVFDFDGDGHLDVLISAVSGGCSLYRNNGDGTFADVSVGSGLDRCVNAWGLAIGDYDNDGLPDVFVSRLGFYDGDTALYRNNGDGTFTDVTKEAGVNRWQPGFTAQWVDYDCDGYIDLFVPASLGGLFHRNCPDALFHNNGDGTFTEVALQAGLRKSAPTVGATWGDYNNDGYPDLFVSNIFGRSQLYRNNGDGSFTEVSREAGIDEPGLGMVATFFDYDDDGWLDIVQFLFCPFEDVLHSLRHGEAPSGGQPSRVYHNNRDGTFTLVNRELGITECWGSMSGCVGDLNNDGFIDLLLGNGGPLMDRTEPCVIFENDGRGRFRNTTFSAGLPYDGKSHGVNLADLSGDGRLSLIIAAGGMYPGDLLTAAVYRPRELPGNYLNVRLTGTKSNKSAVGARLCLETAGRQQHRVVSGGTGFGCPPFEQHFGLARLQHVEGLSVWWPSGLRQRFENLPVNAGVQIVEGEAGWTLIKKGPSPALSDSG